MTRQPGTKGLIFNEPNVWDKSREGRCAISLPKADVDRVPLDSALTGDTPDLPQLSELDVVRHYTRLSQWNFGVDSGMYPLGSCTMKYNPKTNEVQAARQGFAGAHPLAGEAFSQGALQLMYDLEKYLAEITGFAGMTLQPAAGAHGELAGMLIIHAYHAKQGRQRSKIIIPDTAHGTNPASATLCGYKSVNLASGEKGILEPEAVAAVMDEDTAGIMITNPNTLGLFEQNLKEICDIVHAKGGLVYGDGANMNAIMGIVKPGKVGIDVLHLNLHKKTHPVSAHTQDRKRVGYLQVRYRLSGQHRKAPHFLRPFRGDDQGLCLYPVHGGQRAAGCIPPGRTQCQLHQRKPQRHTQSAL